MRVQLNAKQAELDRAVKELDVARRHLAEVRARLKRALVALQKRSSRSTRPAHRTSSASIVEAGGYDDLVNRTEYLNRIHGLDEAIVGRVRDLRDQMKRTVERLRSAKLIGSKPRATRSPPNSGRWPRRGPRCRGARGSSSPPAAAARDALEKIDGTEEQLEGDVAEIQGELAATLEFDLSRHLFPRGDSLRLRRVDLAGRRAGRLRLRHALGPI